jgi:hypothetical protein
VISSKLGRYTGYSGWEFSQIYSLLPGKFQDSDSIRTWSVASKFFPNYHTYIVIPFGAIRPSYWRHEHTHTHTNIRVVWRVMFDRITGFFTFSIVWCSWEKKHDISETGSVSIFRRRGEKTPNLLYHLERVNLNQLSMCLFPLSPEDGSRPSFRNFMSLLPRTPDEEKCQSVQ